MKRIFTLICLVCCVLCTAQAQTVDQTFQFVDGQGNTVPDGATFRLVFTGPDEQIAVPLTVENLSGKEVAVSMYETIDQMPNGTWQTCAFGNCVQLSASGYSSKSIVAGDYKAAIETEWIPIAGQYASWTATLQIVVFNIEERMQFGVPTKMPGNEIIGYGPKVTVTFDYRQDAAISAQTTGDAPSMVVSNLSGQRLSSAVKGLNIIRQGNSTRKVIVR